MLNYGKFLYPPTVKVIVTDEKMSQSHFLMIMKLNVEYLVIV